MSDNVSAVIVAHAVLVVGQFLFARYKRTRIGALVANALCCCCMKCLRFIYLSNDRSLRAMHMLGERCAKSCPREFKFIHGKLAYMHKNRLESASNIS
jgi:hypothetical protein